MIGITNFFYSCEDGNDICINTFDTLNGAKDYAKNNEDVKEIFKYEEDAYGNLECCGCMWKR